MSITSLRGSTLPNKSFSAGKSKTKNIVRIAPDTATTFANGAAISAGGGGGGGPTISNVSVTDSSYILSNTTPYIDSTGGYIKITGTGFATGCTVYVSGTPATSTTFVSATEVRAQVGAASSNAQSVYVVNTDSSVGIKLNAITYSGTPSWSTDSTLTSQLTDISFNIPLSATSDSSIIYTLASGSSVPSGTTLYSNGVFAGTVTGISNDTNYSFTVVATDVENQLSTRAFTVTVTPGDQYMNTTTLLLNGDANVWITDSSTNKFLANVVADTRPSALSPYNANWSVYFNGSSYLDVAASTTFNEFLTGDFTVECWFYYTGTAFTSGPCLLSVATTWSTSVAYNLEVRTGGIVYFHAGDSIPITLTAGGGQAVNILTWNHVAAVRSSGVTTLYVNGFSASSSSASTSISKPAQLMRIGAFSQGGGQQWTGYISNARIVKGQAVYTANFTPSTTSLTTTSQSVTSANVFLGCSTNRFIDANTTPKTISIGSGAPLANTFTPFTETDTITGSAYFDGTGDFINYTSNSAFAFGTGDFTVECWAYISSISTYAPLVQSSSSLVSATNVIWFFAVTSTTVVFNTHASGGFTATTPWTPGLNSWNHFAAVRQSGTMKLFINGFGGTVSVTGTPSGYSLSQAGLALGGMATPYNLTGYLADVRIINGTAQYTSNFTPSTSSLSSVANTQLLTLQYRRGENNHRFVDEGGSKYVAIRNGQVSQGSFSPFSPAGWSGYFDGTGDYLTVPASSDFNFGTDDYTIEGWIYSSSLTWTLYATGGGGSSDQFSCDAGTLYWNYGTFAGITSFFVNSDLNTWTHVAASRTSGNTRVFKNGGLKASTSTVASIGSSVNTLQIGRRSDGFYLTTGYMSNIRVVKGTSQYTANFTPATTALTVVANTKLLILQNNRFIDANTTPKTITTAGDAKVQAFSPFRPSGSYVPATHGGSAYFDGSGDYLKALSTSNTLLPTSTTNTFTIDGWIYPTTTGTRYFIIGDLDPTGASNNVGVDVSTGNKVELYWYPGTATRATSVDSVVPNQWNYFAIVVNANAINIYVNSTTAGQTGTTTLTTRSLATVGWGIGSYNSTEIFTGYMSDIRWSTGIARTISSIPTAPPAPDNYTTFLMKFNNAGIVDATSRQNFETLGNVTISNVTSKFGTGSLYFDGTGDYLAAPVSALSDFGTGDFTVEFWMNASATGTYVPVVGTQSISGFATAGMWRVSTRLNSVNGIYFNYTTGSAFTDVTFTTTNYNDGTWHHVAVVRTSNVLKAYVDGTKVGSDTAITQSLTSGQKLFVGFQAQDSVYYTGYVDDLRITRYARYTGASAPVPTSAHLTK